MRRKKEREQRVLQREKSDKPARERGRELNLRIDKENEICTDRR